MKAVQAFIDAWVDDPLGTKSIFSALFDDLVEKKQVKLEFHERPGISYSLRGIHEKQIDRPLFVMIDVIDDDPNARWLSVCFYGDMIQDPDEHGDFIPEGLLGADGHCFDIDEGDESLLQYVRARIQEAYVSACR